MYLKGSILSMKYIYIVFSATPYKTGTFIRRMLHNRYNHVSLSFDENLSEMYSFSRHHANTPFFAGFVHESFGRYEWNGGVSDIKVCRIAISDKRFDLLRAYIRRMSEESKKYVYNYYSALTTLWNQRVRIHNAYTCVEFVGDLLSMAGLKSVKMGAFHSLQGLEKTCSPYVIYEGSSRTYPGKNDWSGDDFCKRIPVSKGLCDSAAAFGKLTKFGVQDACSFVSGKFHILNK